MNDPWWLVLIKVVVLFVVLLVWTIFNVWYERRLVGKMQHRLGPIMNGPFGLGQALADGMKLLIKEDFMPSMVDRVLFTLAPLIAGVAAFTAWSVIPFGGEVEIFGVTTRLQLADPSVGVLVLLAVTSVGIYGFVLAGWSSNSPYSLLGGLRSSAQMISYEIAMGLSLVAVFLFAGSMSTSEIVELQRTQPWLFLSLLPSFLIYVIAMVGETNRAPFDLPEAVRDLLPRRVHQHGDGLGDRDHAVRGRLPAAVAAQPRPVPQQRLARPDLVHGQGAAVHLDVRVAARHPAAVPLRPVHEPRLEGADPDLAGLDPADVDLPQAAG
jgi:NADH:ubiquinone oxidoreductase subunit H